MNQIKYKIAQYAHQCVERSEQKNILSLIKCVHCYGFKLPGEND